MSTLSSLQGRRPGARRLQLHRRAAVRSGKGQGEGGSEAFALGGAASWRRRRRRCDARCRCRCIRDARTQREVDPFFLPSPASSSSSFASASTPASSSSSSCPSPVLYAAPAFKQRAQRFNLPAPIPVAPLSSTLPAFLATTSPSFGATSLPSKQVPEVDAATLLRQLDAAYPFVIATSPESYAAPLPEPHSPVSSASLSSFHSGEDASSTYSSVSGSPFSLYDDLDFALALSSAPSYPPQPAPFNDYNSLPLFTGPPQLSYDAQPHPAAPLLPSTAFFVDHSNPFLPTAHDGDKTLALPLFGSTPAYQWS
ncbi:hypothetical protein AAT19DRAFT_11538 [Rhodotorula toruloides]|uniref:Uncharacterized protein n=1 Tax=Rhodotorula toruloides TaxID=5286 RepID=A0A2S9ZVV3_RHOTO|nr:hypothetical protein AAT19DRAFT_11538 [Rhodotorula toruloides]